MTSEALMQWPKPPITGPSSEAATSATTATSGSTPESTSDDSIKVQKRGRRSRPKVKTGCTNCKLRRIKCDEKRPACAQCIRSHKECTGYPPPSRHAASYAELRIAPKPVGAMNTAPMASTGTTLVAGPSPLARETVLPPRRASRRHQLYHHDQQAGPPVLVKAPSPLAVTSYHASSPTLYRPSVHIPLQPLEAPYFDLFCARTASELSGYFNTVFWTQRILQECHFEPALRHAAVALGALYKALEQSSNSTPPAEVGMDLSRADMVMPHWQVAVRQYSEACKAMLLLNDRIPNSNRTRLMASVLLSSFDAFIGDHKQAIIQIQSGLGLLERLRVGHADSESGSREFVEEELVTIYTRLFIQAKSYDLAFHFPEPYVIRLDSADPRQRHQSSDPSTPYPESYPDRLSISSPAAPLDVPFSTLREARLAYDHLLEKCLRFIERLHLIKKQPYPLFPVSWRQYGLGFQDELDAWAQAFQPLFETRLAPPEGHHHHHLSPRERSGIAALKMFQLNSSVLFRCMFNSTESHFDAFLPQYRMIVDLGHEIVAGDQRRAAAERCAHHPEEEQRRCATCRRPRDELVDALGVPGGKNGGPAARHIKPSFSTDLGIVPPLFFVATKCREPHTRRRAIRLLRSSARREGMWDSEMAARIGQWVMELEESDGDGGGSPPVEGGMPRGGSPAPALRVDASSALGSRIPGSGTPRSPPSKPIPEEKRVMVHSVDFDLRARFAHLQVGTRATAATSPETDPRRRVTYITW